MYLKLSICYVGIIFSSLSFGLDPRPDNYSLNFGVLEANSNYTIYRSNRLGANGLKKLAILLEKKGLAFPKTIISMNDEGYGDKGNYVIEEFDLQNVYGYSLYHSFEEDNLRTYLDGHNPKYPTEDIDIKGKLTNQRSLDLFGDKSREHIGILDGDIEDFYKVLDIILDKKNQPVLFHCHGGKHRTGMMAMALRYIQGKGLDRLNKHIDVDGMMAHNLIELEYKNYARKVGLFFSGPRSENVRFVRWLLSTDRFQTYVKKYRADFKD